MFYKLAADSWDDRERKAISDVVASGQLTMGPKTAQFEATFARYHGRNFALMVNSGSSANLIGIASLFYKSKNPLHRGDEVIVPAISWSTTYSPLQQYGLKLRFVDVELDTLNMDVSQLKRALTPRTKMIVGVSILGNPAALDVMRKFADDYGLIFFEDNCESLGAELHGKKTGTFGDLSTFSTFYTHHISTIEGGVLTTDDRELYFLAKSIRAHGWTRGVSRIEGLYEPEEEDIEGEYKFILPGYNVRPQEINAAVGLVQLEKFPEMLRARRKNLALFQSLFANDPRFIIQRENGLSSSFCFTIVLSSTNRNRWGITEALAEAGIESRMITGGCFPRHDVIKYFDAEVVGDLPNANLVHDRGFFVGNHPFPLDDQIYKLREALDKECGR